MYHQMVEFTEEEKEGQNMQVNNIECSLSLGLAVMYLQCFRPGNNWESNLALSHCTSKCTGLISSLYQKFSDTLFLSFGTLLLLIPFLKQAFNEVLQHLFRF